MKRRENKLQKEPEPVKAWRARMASDEGKQAMKRRKRIETVNGVLKNRGFDQLLARGIEKVRCVGLLHALAHNLRRWPYHGHRLIAAAGTPARRSMKWNENGDKTSKNET